MATSSSTLFAPLPFDTTGLATSSDTTTLPHPPPFIATANEIEIDGSAMALSRTAAAIETLLSPTSSKGGGGAATLLSPSTPITATPMSSSSATTTAAFKPDLKAAATHIRVDKMTPTEKLQNALAIRAKATTVGASSSSPARSSGGLKSLLTAFGSPASPRPLASSQLVMQKEKSEATLMTMTAPTTTAQSLLASDGTTDALEHSLVDRLTEAKLVQHALAFTALGLTTLNQAREADVPAGSLGSLLALTAVAAKNLTAALLR